MMIKQAPSTCIECGFEFRSDRLPRLSAGPKPRVLLVLLLRGFHSGLIPGGDQILFGFYLFTRRHQHLMALR
jgi:hypothetical protein